MNNMHLGSNTLGATYWYAQCMFHGFCSDSFELNGLYCDGFALISPFCPVDSGVVSVNNGLISFILFSLLSLPLSLLSLPPCA